MFIPIFAEAKKNSAFFDIFTNFKNFFNYRIFIAFSSLLLNTAKFISKITYGYSFFFRLSEQKPLKHVQEFKNFDFVSGWSEILTN